MAKGWVSWWVSLHVMVQTDNTAQISPTLTVSPQVTLSPVSNDAHKGSRGKYFLVWEKYFSYSSWERQKSTWCRCHQRILPSQQPLSQETFQKSIRSAHPWMHCEQDAGYLSQKGIINGLFSKAEIVPWQTQYWFTPSFSLFQSLLVWMAFIFSNNKRIFEEKCFIGSAWNKITAQFKLWKILLIF